MKSFLFQIYFNIFNLNPKKQTSSRKLLAASFLFCWEVFPLKPARIKNTDIIPFSGKKIRALKVKGNFGQAYEKKNLLMFDLRTRRFIESTLKLKQRLLCLKNCIDNRNLVEDLLLQAINFDYFWNIEMIQL